MVGVCVRVFLVGAVKICLRHHSLSGANNTDSMVVLVVDKRARERARTSQRAMRKLSGSLVQYGIASIAMDSRDDLGMY